MFGDIVYQATAAGYVELLLADEQSVQVKLCVLNGVIKLYRVEWWEQDGYTAHVAVYTLLDAIEKFREKAGLTALKVNLSIPWSDDCLSCLCNLPHTYEEHQQAVEKARAALQNEIGERQALIRADGGDEWEPDEETNGASE